MIESVEWIEKDGALRLLDQRALPGREAYLVCRTVEDVALAIENMTVRGAPAIGIAAAYGVVLAAAGGRGAVLEAIERLARTRPTAVNLFEVLNRMRAILEAEPSLEGKGLAGLLLFTAVPYRAYYIFKLFFFGVFLLKKSFKFLRIFYVFHLFMLDFGFDFLFVLSGVFFRFLLFFFFSPGFGFYDLGVDFQLVFDNGLRFLGSRHKIRKIYM